MLEAVAKNGLLRVVSCSLSGGGEDDWLAMAHVSVRLCIIGGESVLAVVTTLLGPVYSQILKGLRVSGGVVDRQQRC